MEGRPNVQDDDLPLSQENYDDIFAYSLGLDPGILDSDIMPDLEAIPDIDVKPFPNGVPSTSQFGLASSMITNHHGTAVELPHCSKSNIQIIDSTYGNTSESNSQRQRDITSISNISSSVAPSSSVTMAESTSNRRGPPIISNWLGRYHFNVHIENPEEHSKKMTWTYSKQRDKLYVTKGEPCPISFTMDSNVPEGVQIRAMPVFSHVTETSHIVERCLYHYREDQNNGIPLADHLMLCEGGDHVSHEVDSFGRHSVVVNHQNPPEGQDFSTYLYKFTCYGSCAGGLNRRPIKVVFTMEKNKEVLGRRSIEVKICACPYRDCRNDDKQDSRCQEAKEKTHGKKRKTSSLDNSTLAEVLNFVESMKKQKTSDSGKEESHKYTFTASSRREYDFLKNCLLLFRLNKMFTNLSPDIIRYLKSIQKIKKEK